MNTTKSPVSSKTLWFNFAVVVLTAVATGIEPISQALQPLLSPGTYILFTTVVGLINTGLRFMTNTGLSLDKRN